MSFFYNNPVEVSGTLSHIIDLNTEGRTIIMITHDAHIAAHAERIVRITDGNISEGDIEDA